MRLAPVVAAVALALLVPGGAGAAVSVHSETRTFQGWTVTLDVTLDGADGYASVTGLRLRAVRGRRTLVDRRVPLPVPCRTVGCEVLDTSVSLFELRRLAGSAPSAVIWLWTGGAHCCSVAQVVPLAGGAVVAKDFGNAGASIRRTGGAPVFFSTDDRFAYLFTSYAASGRPVRLWRLRGERFVDVTASYPGVVGADAREWWQAVERLVAGREEVRGAFAAWAANACRLGDRARVARAAWRLAGRGAFSSPGTEDIGPRGRRYVTALMRTLDRWGYCQT